MSLDKAKRRFFGSRRFIINFSASLAVFALAILYITWQLREELRDQILHREGEVLASVARMQATLSAETLGEKETDESQEDLLTAALQTSRLRGVLAMRLYDEKGSFQLGFPAGVIDAELPREDWIRLQALEKPVRFFPHASPGELYGLPAAERANFSPMVEILCPLANGEGTTMRGVAQFWIDGSTVADEFAQLDFGLVLHAGLAFILGAGLVAVVIEAAVRQKALRGPRVEFLEPSVQDP